MRPESDPAIGAPDRTPGSDAAESARLAQVVDRAHRAIRALAAPPQGTGGTAVRPGDAYDTEVATISAHLAAMESVVNPVARRRLPDGHAVVATQLRLARRIERLMRAMEGRVHGDNIAMPMSLRDAQRDLAEMIDSYLDAEADLARRLDEVLDDGRRRSLVHAFRTAMERAPTRPHPYTPHVRGMSRLTHRLCYVWDAAFDVMDNRVVPAMRPPRRLSPLNSWGRYLLGNPGFDEPPAYRPRRGTPVEDARAGQQPGRSD
jgi:hypothetical protein